MTDATTTFRERLTGTILIVDDEPSLVQMHAARLNDGHEIVTATGGEECLAKMDHSIDVVLLDRRMPDISGDDVLERIRSESYDCMVAMITAVRPEEDIIDMDFDAYLVKPITADELNACVQELLLRADYSTSVRDILAMAAKIGSLRAEHPPETLSSNVDYVRLLREYQAAVADNEGRFENVIDRVDTRLLYADLLDG